MGGDQELEKGEPEAGWISLLGESEELVDKRDGALGLKDPKWVDGAGWLSIELLPEPGGSGYEDEEKVWVLNNQGLRIAVDPIELLKQGFMTLRTTLLPDTGDLFEADLRYGQGEILTSILQSLDPDEPGLRDCYWQFDEANNQPRDVMLKPDPNILRGTQIRISPITDTGGELIQ